MVESLRREASMPVRAAGDQAEGAASNALPGRFFLAMRR